jgi:glutathione synthase/RimK-type ligase-like ATP-grasp enzyme
MTDVVVVTAQRADFPELEAELLAAALTERGVETAIAPWGSDASMAGGLIVIRTTWDYTDDRDAFLAWGRLADTKGVLLNPLDVIVWNSHKSYLLDLAYAGVPMIPTALVPRAASVADQRDVLEEYEGEIVIKPAVSVGAIGALRAVASSPEAAAHLAARVDLGDVLVQPFEPTVTDGEVSLIYLGGEFSHAVRKFPAEGEYRVQEMYGGTIEPHTPTADELAVGVTVLAAVTDELAYARVDLLATPHGPAVMELELIEPQLFLDVEPASAGRLADHLVEVLASR